MVIIPGTIPSATAARKPHSRFTRFCGTSSTASPIDLKPPRQRPVVTASTIYYELGERVGGLAAGGIGAVEDLPHVDLARTPAGFGGREEGFDQLPLFVGQIDPIRLRHGGKDTCTKG